MHEDAPILPARRRERVGSRYAKRLRQRGGMPAVVYGHKTEPMAVEIDAHEARKHFDRGERVFSLAVDGQAEHETILLQDLQFDHLGTNVIHADFRRVDLTERVEVSVPLEFIGDAKGLKTAGAIMIHALTELELECAVTNLPDVLEVDVSDLGVGEHLTAGDIPLPRETMRLRTDPDTTVATIRVQSAVADDEQGEVEGGAAPEVLTEKKKED